MRIKIRNGKVRLFFAVPLGLFKSRLGCRVICQMLNRKDNDEDSTPENASKNDTQLTRAQVVEIVNGLKKFVKTNGHFNLVEVASVQEKTFVKIRI